MTPTRRAPSRIVAPLAVVALAFAFALAATSASAAPLRQIVPSVVAFSSDGVRYAAYETRAGAPLVVLDTISGRRSSVPVPAGCQLEGESEGAPDGALFNTFVDGQALITCPGGHEALLDVSSGAVRSLPGNETDWYQLGTRYVRGNEKGENEVVFDLATGTVKRIGGFEWVDLDEPEAPGPRSACPALRATLTRIGPAMVVHGGVAAEYAEGIFAGPLGSRGDVQIARCSGARRVLAGQHVSGHDAPGHVPRDFAVGGGVLSWDTGAPPEATNLGETRPRGFYPRLEALSLATARKHRWNLPRREPESTVGAFGYSAHTANSVFWLATHTTKDEGEAGVAVTSYTLYSASLQS